MNCDSASIVCDVSSNIAITNHENISSTSNSSNVSNCSDSNDSCFYNDSVIVIGDVIDNGAVPCNNTVFLEKESDDVIFNDSVNISNARNNDSNSSESVDPWNELKCFRSSHVKNLIIGALNINSLRNKFNSFKHVLTNGYVDFFTISESKLDESFPVSQFYVKGFYVHRQDSTAQSGGLVTWVRNDLPNNRRYDIECNNDNMQTICIEIHLNKEKWFIISIYRLPHSCVNDFENILCKMLDKALCESNMIVIIGDINIDISKQCSNTYKLRDILNLYNLHNKVDSPTCFKGETPSTIDLCLVSQPRRFGSVFNWNCGLSDWHNMIAIATKLRMSKASSKVFNYRSYKNFSSENFCRDVSCIPFQIIDIFDDIDDKYSVYNSLLSDVVNEHAPLKTRYVNGNSAPHMNSELKKLMYKKRMLQNAYWKNKGNSKLWEEYRRTRNAFVKLSRQSRRKYFSERCHKGSKDHSFWKAIKPYMTNKVSNSNDIMLKEGDDIVSDSDKIANVFSHYYRDVIDQIGSSEACENLCINDIILKYNNHSSIRLIKDHCNTDECIIQTLTVTQVQNILSKINPKKATGFDNLPPKLLHLARMELSPSLTYIINDVISNSKFPSDLKNAEIVPCFKKGNPLDKTKYRPVSVLSCISKIVESAIDTQISEIFYSNKAGCLSAYRKKHNTQSVLVKAVDDWKRALDNGKYCGALLMDLSKAFDVIPHGLLLAKLNAYGFDIKCLKLIQTYLYNRYQRVKVKQARSEWTKISKGVPQGSLLGPTLFNIFLNDLLFSVNDYDIYNYADDNTVSYVSQTSADLASNIELCGNILTEWFMNNGMQANPNKYQAIVFGSKNDKPENFTIKGHEVKCMDNVNLLGVEIDNKLLFNDHVSKLCKKASQQINAISRLRNVLDVSVKEQIFTSFIKSTFSYCPAVWMFCGQGNISKLDRLQHRALRFVYNDYDSSYFDLLNRSKSLEVSDYLKYTMCIEVYKCTNSLLPDYLCDLFKKKEQCYDMRDNNKLIQRKFKSITHGYKSFSYYGAKIWNDLSNDLKCSSTLMEFKVRLKAKLSGTD